MINNITLILNLFFFKQFSAIEIMINRLSPILDILKKALEKL